MRFGVLGPLRVWTDDGTPVPIPGAKVRALLADLLVQPGRAVSADRLIDDLWGAERPGNPTGALQAKVSELRRALAGAEPGGRELVAYQAPGYLLRIEPEAVDAGRFAALTAAARAERDPVARAARLADALAIWRGGAFDEFADAEFARAAITRLTEQRLTAAEEHAEARLAAGEHAALAGELSELIEQHPLRERLVAVQMRALYLAGRQAEALAGYGRLRQRFAEELGIDPSPELAQLHQAILTQDAELNAPASQQAPTGVNAAHTNLPAPVAQLVGRFGTAEQLGALLDTERLVTLTGPGGVGKTKLAVQAARHAAEQVRHGPWFIDLAGVNWHFDCSGAGELADLVSDVLGVRDDTSAVLLPHRGQPDSTARLVGALREPGSLLVFDNCEHVIELVAELVDQLLQAVPGLRVLATSREPLGVPGERLWPVSPLDLPTADPDPDLDTLRESGAVQLFVARAAAAEPGFALTRANGAAIATICRELDGLPLALELAAARVRVLGVHDLAVRVRDRFRLLTSGPRTAPARQRTLRAMIDWSWELLSAAEQAVLRRLAVPLDGCTLASAEEVCAGSKVESADVFDLLARLVDRSL